MALIKCVECGREISSMAKACPQCGCPIMNSLIHAAGIGKNNDLPERARENLLATETDKGDLPVQIAAEKEPQVQQTTANDRIVCPECGKEISFKAKACPQCGCPMAQKEEAEEAPTPAVDLQEIANKADAKFRPLGVLAVILLVLSAVAAVVFGVLHEHVLRAVSLSVMISLFVLGTAVALGYWIGHKAYSKRMLASAEGEDDAQKADDPAGRAEQ